MHYGRNHFSEQMNAICNEFSKNLSCTLCLYTAKRRSDLNCHIGVKHEYINNLLLEKGYNIIISKKRKRKNEQTTQDRETDTEVKVGKDHCLAFENDGTNIDNDRENKESIQLNFSPVEEEENSDALNFEENFTFPCNFCSVKFQTETMLSDHITFYHNRKKFSCDECSKTFTQNTNLRTHKKLHSGIKPYKCEFCDQSFAQKGNRKVHQEKYHN